MDRPPRPRGERLLNGPMLMRSMVFLGSLQAAAAMAAFFAYYLMHGWNFSMGVAAMASSGAIYMGATTMTHAAVVTTQMGNAFAQRTNRQSVFAIGFFSNRFLLWGILVEAIEINILIYVQPFQHIFGHYPLGVLDWVILVSLIPLLFVADEIRKYILRVRDTRRALVAAARVETMPQSAPALPAQVGDAVVPAPLQAASEIGPAAPRAGAEVAPVPPLAGPKTPPASARAKGPSHAAPVHAKGEAP